MEYRRLGNSDLNISRLGFGCMSLGLDHAENAQLLHMAVDSGINFFDTADLYQQGQNEITVGKALREIRKDAFIATKVGNRWRADGTGWDWVPGKAYIMQAVRESLQRLQTDYIDLYQLHGGTLDDPIEDIIEAFELLRQQGQIRFYGISSIRPNVIREYVRRQGITSVMMQYSLADRRPEENCLDLTLQNNIGVLARGSLAKGLLIDKLATPYLDYTIPEIEKAALAIKQVSGSQRSASSATLHFVWNNPAISAAVVGIRTMEQLKTAIMAANDQPFGKNEMEQLRRAIKQNFYKEHR